MSKKRREIAAANTNYIKHQIITHNRRRWRTLYRNMPKYAIDRDTWLVRHGQWFSPKRSDRAIKARVEHSLKACGYTEAQIVKWIEQNRRRQL